MEASNDQPRNERPKRREQALSNEERDLLRSVSVEMQARLTPAILALERYEAGHRGQLPADFHAFVSDQQRTLSEFYYRTLEALRHHFGVSDSDWLKIAGEASFIADGEEIRVYPED